MALQGTLRDFGLADIFQLIGIQRKTGVLTVRHQQEVATVAFLNGQVVYADTLKRRLELRVGTLLVKQGKISSVQLEEALRIQSSTLQRLGSILISKNIIPAEDLKEVLHLQVTQVVYDLFRWNDGEYHFSQEESVDYDENLLMPVSADTLLMEGARMTDEWPLIERRIPSFDIVFRPKREVVEEDASSDGQMLDLDFDLGGGSVEAPMPGLAEEETRIYRLVDGKRTVQDIVDLSPFVEFETCRILCDLLSRDLLVAASEESEQSRGARRGWNFSFAPLLRFVVPLVIVVSVLTLPKNPFSPLGKPSIRLLDEVLTPASRSRLSRIEMALHVYYLERQNMPGSLEELVEGGFLEDGDLLDPWGRPYAYRLEPNRFVLSGSGPAGEADPALVVTELLSGSQQLLIDPGVGRGS